jgi:hypothetical protein
VNRQARPWLSEIANHRQHRETRQRPIDRFQPAALKPLPIIPYDYRDSVEALVHKDLRVQFDGNRYCVSQRYVGRHLMVKADSNSVAIYGVARPLERSVLKRNWPICAPLPKGRVRSSACSCFSITSVLRRCSKRICATSPIPTVHFHANCRNCSNSSASKDRKPWLARFASSAYRSNGVCGKSLRIHTSNA